MKRQRSVRHKNILIGLTSLVAFTVLWELAVSLHLVHPVLVSSPWRIAQAAFQLCSSGQIVPHLLTSLTEFALGFALAAALGISFGIIAGWYPTVFAASHPFIIGLNASPRIALMPLIIMWVGIGTWSKVLIVFLGAFFPIAFNMMTALHSLDPNLLRAARSFGANDTQVFRTLALPASVPFLITGLRLGAGRALVGIVVGEMYGSNTGLGYLIGLYGSTFQTDKVMVSILVITTLGILFDFVLRKMEGRFEAWRPQN